MAVETSTTISGLNAAWPLGSDLRSEGDNHLRLIKAVLQSVFDDSGAVLKTTKPYGGLRDFVFTTSGIWTKPSDLKYLDVILVGGGGGSSNVPATAAGQASASSGGGAGAVIQARYKASDLPATVAYTVGAGGTAATTATAGGNSTFKLLTAGGGAGGGGGGPTNTVGNTVAAAGGVASSTETGIRQILTNGGDGGPGWFNSPNGIGWAWPGQGGVNMFVPLRPQIPALSTRQGGGGVSPGGGATGACNGVSQGAQTGGAGAVGILYLTEWF